MAVLASGSLRLWDVEGQKLVIGTSLPPLRGAKGGQHASCMQNDDMMLRAL